jgi:hypothetical protein
VLLGSVLLDGVKKVMTVLDVKPKFRVMVSGGSSDARRLLSTRRRGPWCCCSPAVRLMPASVSYPAQRG